MIVRHGYAGNNDCFTSDAYRRRGSRITGTRVSLDSVVHEYEQERRRKRSPSVFLRFESRISTPLLLITSIIVNR